jgi:uncharacterized damage-inducible protein DinB
MKARSLAVISALIFAVAPAVCDAQSATAPAAHPSAAPPSPRSDTALLAQDRANFRLMLTSAVRPSIVAAAEAMPADKYGFAPTVGEFQNVRTFSRQIRHLAATNFILAAAALGQDPPADAGDEEGPDSVVTKAQHLAYLNRSFDALEQAIDAIGDSRLGVRASPISPFQGNTATRISLVSEALTHAFDHYGQMVIYLRMNGVIPPASRR